MDHLKKVMQGKVKSKRHALFFNKRERETCSGIDTSNLYHLSNPGFLGGHGQKDSFVVNELMENVFNKYFNEVSRSVINFLLIHDLLFILVG